MDLALATGQPFLDLLEWHPRDVATAGDLLDAVATERRMDQARAHMRQMTGG